MTDGTTKSRSTKSSLSGSPSTVATGTSFTRFASVVRLTNENTRGAEPVREGRLAISLRNSVPLRGL